MRGSSTGRIVLLSGRRQPAILVALLAAVAATTLAGCASGNKPDGIPVSGRCEFAYPDGSAIPCRNMAIQVVPKSAQRDGWTCVGRHEDYTIYRSSHPDVLGRPVLGNRVAVNLTLLPRTALSFSGAIMGRIDQRPFLVSWQEAGRGAALIELPVEAGDQLAFRAYVHNVSLKSGSSSAQIATRSEYYSDWPSTAPPTQRGLFLIQRLGIEPEPLYFNTTRTPGGVPHPSMPFLFRIEGTSTTILFERPWHSTFGYGDQTAGHLLKNPCA